MRHRSGRITAAAAVAVGLGSAYAAAVLLPADDARGAGGTTCSEVTIPADTDDSSLDVTSKTIEFNWHDSAGRNVSVTVPYGDPACRLTGTAREKVRHVLRTGLDAQVKECQAMQDQERAGVTSLRGGPVNPAARREYLRRWCTDPAAAYTGPNVSP